MLCKKIEIRLTARITPLKPPRSPSKIFWKAESIDRRGKASNTKLS
jgi:hypothetical protein